MADVVSNIFDITQRQAEGGIGLADSAAFANAYSASFSRYVVPETAVALNKATVMDFHRPDALDGVKGLPFVAFKAAANLRPTAMETNIGNIFRPKAPTGVDLN